MTATGHDDDKTEQFDPLVMSAQARVGRVLKEKWKLDALLGVGGMAAVYAATHRNGSRVAIKILHPELSVSANIRARFLREGYAANAVGHAGVVHVSDDDVAEDGAAFLVMELLDGETLEERRKRSGGRLSEDEVLSVADQLLDVLVAAHAKGIIHRDLKPENVFLTRDGRVKVLDFGIARLKEMSNASHATRTGHSMGTPSFMPPEQARALWDQVDGRSDIWSVGATMFSLLSGTEVHSGRSVNEVLIAAATKPAPHLASVLTDVSPAVARVVDEALAFERDHRWRDAAAMQDAVRSAYHHRHGAPISSAPRLTVPPMVVDRTLASAGVNPVLRAPPTTNGGVSSSHVGASQARALESVVARFSRPSPIALGVGGVVIAAAIGVGVSVVSGSKTPASSAAEITTIAPARSELSAQETVSNSHASPPATPAAPGPNAAPVIAVTDLSTETDAPREHTKPAPRPANATAKTDGSRALLYTRDQPPVSGQVPATSTATTAKTTRPNCSPPYVLDPATGKKKWKAECF